MGWNLVIEILMAAATAAAATTPSAREPPDDLAEAPLLDPFAALKPKAESRSSSRALRTGNLLHLVQHNLFKVRLAISQMYSYMAF